MKSSSHQEAAARHAARRCAVQALYQWQLTALPPQEIVAQFHEDKALRRAAPEYFEALLQGVIAQVQELDEMLAGLLDRPVRDVTPVELAVLRIGAWELLYQPELPYRVVLNEAILLARSFGASQSYKYVNGVLDNLAQRVRDKEHTKPSPSQKNEKKSSDL